MTDFTPEQLDKARAEEAARIFHSASRTPPDPEAVIAARLARENWQPPVPVDPVLLKVREIAASLWRGLNREDEALKTLAGKRDDSSSMKHALSFYMAGRSAALAETEERYGEAVRAAKQIRGWYRAAQGEVWDNLDAALAKLGEGR